MGLLADVRTWSTGLVALLCMPVVLAGEDIDSVLRIAYRHGYPDFRGAVTARMTIEATVGAEDFPLLQSMTGSGDWDPSGDRRRQRSTGIYARLADGRIAMFPAVFESRPGWEVAVTAMAPVPPPKLLRMGPGSGGEFAERISGWFVEDDRPRLRSVLCFDDGHAGLDQSALVASQCMRVVAVTVITGRQDDALWTSLAAATAFLLDGSALPAPRHQVQGSGGDASRLRKDVPTGWALSTVSFGEGDGPGPTPPAALHGRLRLPGATDAVRRGIACWLLQRHLAGDSRAMDGIREILAQDPAGTQALSGWGGPAEPGARPK